MRRGAGPCPPAFSSGPIRENSQQKEWVLTASWLWGASSRLSPAFQSLQTLSTLLSCPLSRDPGLAEPSYPGRRSWRTPGYLFLPAVPLRSVPLPASCGPALQEVSGHPPLPIRPGDSLS